MPSRPPRPGPPPQGQPQRQGPPAGEPPRERDFGHDGVSGLVTTARALRAREVCRPALPEASPAAPAAEGAPDVVAALVARVEGRRSG